MWVPQLLPWFTFPERVDKSGLTGVMRVFIKIIASKKQTRNAPRSSIIQYAYIVYSSAPHSSLRELNSPKCSERPPGQRTRRLGGGIIGLFDFV